MVYFYNKGKINNYNNIINYFENCKIKYKVKEIKLITKEEIKKIMYLCYDLNLLIKKDIIINFQDKPLNDLINYILINKNYLKENIIVDFDKKILVTRFNLENLEIFDRLSQKEL